MSTSPPSSPCTLAVWGNVTKRFEHYTEGVALTPSCTSSTSSGSSKTSSPLKQYNKLRLRFGCRPDRCCQQLGGLPLTIIFGIVSHGSRLLADYMRCPCCSVPKRYVLLCCAKKAATSFSPVRETNEDEFLSMSAGKGQESLRT